MLYEPEPAEGSRFAELIADLSVQAQCVHQHEDRALEVARHFLDDAKAYERAGLADFWPRARFSRRACSWLTAEAL